MFLRKKTSDVSDSPGVKGGAGEQGAVVVVTDEVRRRRGAIAGGRLADGADVDRVLGVPYVQQEDVIHQHGVRRNHATYREEQASLARVSRGGGRSQEEGRRGLTCPDAPIGQVRRDGDPPALPHTHALKAAVHAGDEPAQTHLADEGLASVMAVMDQPEPAKHKRGEKKSTQLLLQLRRSEISLHPL